MGRNSPPAVAPTAGKTLAIVGAAPAVNVNACGAVTVSPSALVTTTSTTPATWLGVLTVTLVPSGATVWTGAPVPPKETVAPRPKPVPWTTIVALPCDG